MTVLVPMRPEAFSAFAEESIADYARNNVDAGRWTEPDAPDRARAEFDRLLPQGLQTPEHHFYEVQDELAQELVGHLWFALQGSGDARAGYVYSIRIQSAFRGRGHAKAALELGEKIAAAEGAAIVALHVFAFNTSALALYRSLGYGITGMNMLKRLRRPGEPAP